MSASKKPLALHKQVSADSLTLTDVASNDQNMKPGNH